MTYTIETAADIAPMHGSVSHIDDTGAHPVAVMHSGRRFAMTVPLCSGCDAPVAANGLCEACDMIPAAVAFNKAIAAYAEHEAASQELNLDIMIAKRGTDAEAVTAAEAAFKAHAQNWHPLYRARGDAALALCSALGVDARDLRSAMPL